MSIQIGDTVRLKMEKPTLYGSTVKVTGRSGRYAGYEVEFQDGMRGIALDSEIAGKATDQ